MKNPLEVDPIPRDQWGRPLIVPVGGGRPIGYTRVSTLAKAIGDTTALTNWKCRMTALGVAKRQDLAAMALAKANDKGALDEVVETAMTAAGSESGRNMGTALHAFTEVIDKTGQMPDDVSLEVKRDLEAYRQAMADHGLSVIGMETFVVIDSIKAAGSFDRVLQTRDGRLVIGDIKTGQNEPDYPHGATIQMGTYSRGTVYNPTPKEGEQHRAARSLAQYGVDQNIAYLVHLPSGKGRCDIYEVDIALGWQMAQVATHVRIWNKSKPIRLVEPGEVIA